MKLWNLPHFFKDLGEKKTESLSEDISYKQEKKWFSFYFLASSASIYFIF